MSDRFIYDEKTSVLYAPDGRRLKQVHCPKAMHWNQLTIEQGEYRWRGCTQCNQRVINLDVMPVVEAVAVLARLNSTACVHGSADSGRVIFLKDRDAIPRGTDLKTNGQGRTPIRTARSVDEVNRAANLGYWPDVRRVRFDTENFLAEVKVRQHADSGHISLNNDPRAEADRDRWAEIIPTTRYYPYYQPSPIAAYLVPRHLPDGAQLLIMDPIEDVAFPVREMSQRVLAIPGRLAGRRVVLGRPDPIVPMIVG